MKKKARAWLFCILWLTSITFGFFLLLCPLLPLLLFRPTAFRSLSDWTFCFWSSYSSSLLDCLCSLRISVEGDEIRTGENSLLIINHRTRTDWLYLWSLLRHYSTSYNNKMVIKDSVKRIPILGWAMQMCRFLFVRRCWKLDRIPMRNSIDYLARTTENFQILLFPEGTDLTESNLIKSHNYAHINGLDKYQYVLHPRSRGLIHSIQRMRQNNCLDAVYSITVAYPDVIPQNVIDLLSGNIPKRVHFLVKRYDNLNLPSHPLDLDTWIRKEWRQKEQYLKSFYEDTSILRLTEPKSVRSSSALVFWTCLIICGVFLFCSIVWVRIWCALNTLIFLTISALTRGLDQIEIELACNTISQKATSRNLI